MHDVRDLFLRLGHHTLQHLPELMFLHNLLPKVLSKPRVHVHHVARTAVGQEFTEHLLSAAHESAAKTIHWMHDVRDLFLRIGHHTLQHPSPQDKGGTLDVPCTCCETMS